MSMSRTPLTYAPPPQSLQSKFTCLLKRAVHLGARGLHMPSVLTQLVLIPILTPNDVQPKYAPALRICRWLSKNGIGLLIRRCLNPAITGTGADGTNASYPDHSMAIAASCLKSQGPEYRSYHRLNSILDGLRKSTPLVPSQASCESPRQSRRKSRPQPVEGRIERYPCSRAE